jgi:putative membrane protein
MNDTQLANDRTFLAWLRTGISLFGFGFVIGKIALVVETGTEGLSDKVLYTTIGVLMVLSGAALIVFGYRQHASIAMSLDAERPTPPPRWARTITAAAVVGALALSILIVVTT